MKTTGVVPEAFAASISLLSRSETDAMPSPFPSQWRVIDPSAVPPGGASASSRGAPAGWLLRSPPSTARLSTVSRGSRMGAGDQVAPGGIEPPHAGSSPAAPSTELRGRSSEGRRSCEEEDGTRARDHRDHKPRRDRAGPGSKPFAASEPALDRGGLEAGSSRHRRKVQSHQFPSARPSPSPTPRWDEVAQRRRPRKARLAGRWP